ncbi:MAG: hypothetical protein KDC74_01620 [Flavobacteriaceae bacterium]|nr:hypothetical protein [Flavobacteriaceae bacterium]
MGKIWIITIAVAIFLIINLLYSKILKDYVKKAFGKKWLNTWGNKLYFWQSSIFVSTAGTFLIMYLLKWSNILTF